MRTMLTAAALLVTTSAFAEDVPHFISGSDLHRLCTSSQREAHAFIVGVNDGAIMTIVVRQASPLYCPPESVDSRDLMTSVCEHLDKNRDSFSEAGSTVVYWALEKKWPC